MVEVIFVKTYPCKKDNFEKFLPNVLNTGMCAYRILVFLAQPFAIQLSAEVVCLVMGLVHQACVIGWLNTLLYL